MNQDQPLRRLLDELHSADAERQGQQRDTPAYDAAMHRVERLVKAVWNEAGEAPGSPSSAQAAAPDDATDR